MGFACREVQGMPEPALHIPRWPFIRANIVKWFVFLNKRPQRGRDGHCGNEVGTLRRDIQIGIDR